MASLLPGFQTAASWRKPRTGPSFVNSSVFRTNSEASRTGHAYRISCDCSSFEAKDIFYRPPGTQKNLLNKVNFSLPEKSLGLIYGRSGSGKTTLLQVLSGLSKPTSGSFYIQRYGSNSRPRQPPEALHADRVGIVFQFPERFFVAETVLDELMFGRPRRKGDIQLMNQLASRLKRVISWVRLDSVSLTKAHHSLSGGYKRRLALAIQLVRVPELLLLDEPLAGLDWQARADIVELLKHLKESTTILVVSHDLKDLAALVDKCWEMEEGGVLSERSLPL